MIMQRGIKNKREKVCKFQMIFGMVLIILGVVGVVVSAIFINKLVGNFDPSFDENDSEVWKMGSLLMDTTSRVFLIDIFEKIILLSAIFILEGILFYTEGRKG